MIWSSSWLRNGIVWPLMTGAVEMSSFRPWLDISLVWCQTEMSVVSCHYMSHSISQYYGPHRETNLNIITARVSIPRSRSYFLIIPPGLQSAVYSVATTGQALSTSHLLVQICTSNYHLAPHNSQHSTHFQHPANIKRIYRRKSAQLQIESETEEMIGGQGRGDLKSYDFDGAVTSNLG